MKMLGNIAPTVLALYSLLQYYPYPRGGFPGVIYSTVTLAALVVLPSIGITYLIERMRKKFFTRSEVLTVVSAISLFGIPFIVLASLALLPSYFIMPSLVIYSGISCILIYRNKALLSGSFERKDYMLLGGIVFVLSFIWIACHAYYPLPDRDPYSWLSRYLSFIAAHNSGKLGLSDRPGFFAFLFLYNAIARIDAYALLKYVLPLLYAASLFPLWMLARRLNVAWRFAGLSAVFWSASTVLYALTPMPQMLFISALFFAISCMTYSRITGEKFYLYMAGIIFALCIPLYEASLLVFLIWLAVTCWHERRLLDKHFFKNPVALVLLALLVSTNIPLILSRTAFIGSWSSKAISSISLHSINLLFPAYYTNIDGNAVGWSGAFGVIEYYAYYAGLPTLFIIGAGVYLFLQKSYRALFFREFVRSSETQIVAGIFLLFFTISEVLPRALSLALLPERSWIIIGIVAIYPAILVFPLLPKRISLFFTISILLLVVPNMAGALYVNYQKQFLITEEQLASAAWIEKNLPSDRIMISDVNGNLLTFYSHSPVTLISPLFCKTEFKNANVFLSTIHSSSELNENNKNIEQMLLNIRNSILQAKPLNNDDIASVLMQYANQQTQPNVVSPPKKTNTRYYVYYSADNTNDPYRKRPYVKKRELCEHFVFDDNPSEYERVYTNGTSIIIWHVK